jgi:hypothetical protein
MIDARAPEIRPIFIVGSPRSVTTLLRFMLSSHPKIYIPDETGFIPYLLKPSRLEQPLTLDEVERILGRIAELNYLWRNLVPDVPAFYKKLPVPTLAYLLDTLYQQIIAPFHASRWGDKTPLYVRHIPTLRTIFPAAQFIHVIRDGRDATLSAQKKWGLSQHWYMDNYYLLKNWVNNVTIGQKSGAYLSTDQYLEICYEQLVCSPDEILQQVCEFLGEEYDSAMLGHNHLAQQVGPGPDNHTEVMRPVSTASVQRWKFQMSNLDLKIADRVAGPLLVELGYERYCPGQFSVFEWSQICLLALKYKFSASLRWALYVAGFLTLNRNMRNIKILAD